MELRDLNDTLEEGDLFWTDPEWFRHIKLSAYWSKWYLQEMNWRSPEPWESREYVDKGDRDNVFVYIGNGKGKSRSVVWSLKCRKMVEIIGPCKFAYIYY